MSSSTWLLDFFTLEASEYVEQLRALLGTHGEFNPDPIRFTRIARSLRGSATMARLNGIARLGGALERVGRLLDEGTLHPTPSLRDSLQEAVRDLDQLVRNVRSWGPAEDERAQHHVARLEEFAPALPRRTNTPESVAQQTSAAYLAAECAQLAAVVDAFVAKPAQRDTLGVALVRVRAIRGVAAVKDAPPLATVLESIEHAGGNLGHSGAPTATQLAILGAASRVLRRASEELVAVGRPDPESPEAHAFAAVVADAEHSAEAADEIVPMGALYYEDAGPHIVSSANVPESARAQRFRLEVVGLAEHAQRLVAEARGVYTRLERDRVARALRGVLRNLHTAARGFGEHGLAAFMENAMAGVDTLDAVMLTSVDDIARVLSSPSYDHAALQRRLATSRRPTPGAAQPQTAFARALSSPPPRPGARTPAFPAPPPASSTFFTPPGGEDEVSVRASDPAPGTAEWDELSGAREVLRRQVEDGLAGFAALEQFPLAEPAPLTDEEDLPPISDLLYHGRSALDRARELRDELRATGTAPAAEALDELYDLLDLASAE